MNFQAGDLVQLKSGGPVMTVSSCGDDGFGEMRVYCVWFNEKNEEKHGDYPPATLDKVERGAGGGKASSGGSWLG